MKMRGSFFDRKDCAVTALFNVDGNWEQNLALVRRSAADGADAIAIQLMQLPGELRTVDRFRELMDAAPELPFMFINYRSDCVHGNDDEARQQCLLDAVRAGEQPELTTREKHTRECYVVAEEGADLERIEREIKTMPNYFADYDTTVTFITMEELKRDHAGIPHGGSVIRTGVTGWNGEHTHVIEYSLKLDSNPEFTSSVLVAFARAIYKMHGRGVTGCKTVFDVAPADLSPLSPEELRAHML
jgi:hypothetical protein